MVALAAGREGRAAPCRTRPPKQASAQTKLTSILRPPELNFPDQNCARNTKIHVADCDNELLRQRTVAKIVLSLLAARSGALGLALELHLIERIRRIVQLRMAQRRQHPVSHEPQPCI